MKHYIKILSSLLLGSFLACSSSDDKGGTPSPYEQYGAVFANMPEAPDAVIYQVNIRAFSQEGTLEAVRAKLDYIKELGVNVIYLMPVFPVGEMNAVPPLGSPYSVRNYKEINPDFGTMDELRALVAEAHSKDMAVILDWVANHTSYDNPWVEEHPEFYVHDENGNIISPPGTNWADVAQLNYDNRDMRNAMIDAMSYWVYTANIDGFRCDAADFVPQNFWKEALTTVRKIKQQNMLMLAEGTRKDHFQSGFDYTFGFGFFDGLKKLYGENKPATSLQDVNAVEYSGIYNNDDRIVRYTTNHDVNWSDGTPNELYKGRDGALAAFAVAATMKSIPFIYDGQEIGWNQRINYFDRTPIDWNAVDVELLAEYRKIIVFRKSSVALKKGTFKGYANAAVTAFTMDAEGETVFVIANHTNAAANYIVPPALSGTWTDGLANTSVTLGTELQLAPFQYRILKK